MMTTVRLLWIIYVGDQQVKKGAAVLIELIDLDHCQELGLLLYKRGREGLYLEFKVLSIL